MASTSSSSTDAKVTSNALEDILPEPLLPSVSSFSSSSMVYDVFLNHRGCDVKEGLAKDFYHALNGLGLRVFLDKEVLEDGDSIPREIDSAMRSASLCIAFFSPKYAESPWCLEELSFMLKNGTKIIPVFYNVKPSDLRWVAAQNEGVAAKGKEVYAEAFSNYENKKRYMPQKLEEWKTALSNVSLLNGVELKSKEDENRLLNSIVNSVLKDIGPLEVAPYPVALDEIIDDLKKSAFESSHREKDVNIVGIVGMGGSGKTTLAKALYNKECLNFDRHVFIFGVRDAADRNTLHHLQRKLLRGLLSEKFDLSIDNITVGKGILRTRLRSLRVLIVLDDVGQDDLGDVDQIAALLPEKGIFAAGSLIIVTTRELDVLQSFDISRIHKMKALNSFHCKQLLCWHAFRQPDPVQEFEDLVEKVMNACQGLPLSLKVLGAQLYKKPKAYWDSLLDKISRILHKGIEKILKISFDALDREEKEMFLDTACFFLGEQKSLAIEVWNGSGWSGLHGWETLLSKCLVELDQQNRIVMHDHLRDMGRQIAMEGPSYRLLPSSRNLDICSLVEERKSIRGIMEASTHHSGYSAEPFSNYKPLFKEYIESKPSRCGVQLLVAVNSELSEEYATLSKELRWLRLFKFQHSCLPPWLSLENLRVLELCDPLDLKELWQDNMQQPPLQLRELIIHLGYQNRSFQRFPRSIGRLRDLKKLTFTGRNHLQNLPEEFCNLQSLEHLVLKDLECPSSLPRRFGDLTNLRHLNLTFCSQLKMLPDSFADLTNLRHLNLTFCSQLKMLPDSFGDLTNLRHLNLAYCSQLKMLPSSFKQLKSLQFLNLPGRSDLTFTEHNADILENITKLEYLSFHECKGLKVLPHHITQQVFLRELQLEGTSFSELPSSIGQLERLEVLTIGSEELESLPDSLGNLSSLTRLKIISCQKLRSLPDSLGNLSSLTRLEISSCEKLRSLPESLGRLPLLEYIDLSSTGVKSLPKAFGHLIRLQELTITHSPIRELFSELEESSTLPRLTHIILEDTSMSTLSIPEDFCPRLKTLHLSCHDFLEEIRTLPRTVEAIALSECTRLKDISGIGSMRNLQDLFICDCPELAELPSFAEFASMRNFHISICQNLGKIVGLEQLTSLEKLEVDTQWEVPGITSLEHAQGLRELRLSADNIGAVEPCIKTLQKWPGEVKICARASSDGVASLVKAFTASNLMVVEACADGDDGAEETERSDEADVYDKDEEDDVDEEADEDESILKYRKTYLSHTPGLQPGGVWRFGDMESCWSHEPTILCFVINCLSQDSAMWSVEGPGLHFMELREGKWVWIGVVSHRTHHENDLEIGLDNQGDWVEKGVLARGEERGVKDVFYQVLDALKL